MASTTYTKYAEIYKNRTKSQDSRVSKLFTSWYKLIYVGYGVQLATQILLTARER